VNGAALPRANVLVPHDAWPDHSGMPVGVLPYAPAEGFDTGRFVGRYLQSLALLQVAWMIARPIFFDAFVLDLSPVITWWVGSALKRRSAVARKWLLLALGFGLSLCAFMVGRAVLFGTEGLTLHAGRPIRNPALWQVLAACGAAAAVIGVPFAVLLSERARRQFLTPAPGGVADAQAPPDRLDPAAVGPAPAGLSTGKPEDFGVP
jgi:hypothetical protein